jgi:hypothetical protein
MMAQVAPLIFVDDTFALKGGTASCATSGMTTHTTSRE